MTKARLEAFSDGVFAIVVTLLVLDLRGPVGDQSIADALGSQGYTIAAYVVAFLVIGVLWMNHHAIFRLVDRVDRQVMFVNLLLLMMISATPYTASLFADGLSRGGFDAQVGAAVFSAVFVGIGLTYGLLYWMLTRPALIAAHLDPRAARAAMIRFAGGNLFYPLLVGLSFVSPVAVLVLHGVAAVYYAFDQVPADAFRRIEDTDADAAERLPP